MGELAVLSSMLAQAGVDHNPFSVSAPHLLQQLLQYA
jgi:hypothetical protein